MRYLYVQRAYNNDNHRNQFFLHQNWIRLYILLPGQRFYHIEPLLASKCRNIMIAICLILSDEWKTYLVHLFYNGHLHYQNDMESPR